MDTNVLTARLPGAEQTSARRGANILGHYRGSVEKGSKPERRIDTGPGYGIAPKRCGLRVRSVAGGT